MSYEYKSTKIWVGKGQNLWARINSKPRLADDDRILSHDAPGKNASWDTIRSSSAR